LYDGKISKDTVLSEILGKVIIVVDTTYSPNYTDFKCGPGDDKTCVNLSDMVNINSSTTDLKSTDYLTLLDHPKHKPTVSGGSDDGTMTDIVEWQMVTPEIGMNYSASNPDVIPFYRDYGVQNVFVRVYLNDNNLKKYQDLFTNLGKTAFVSMAKMTIYMQRIGNY
jgi:hypothetical protein